MFLEDSMKTVIAIGALGGSGTRAIAQLLIEAGIYMGDDLNGPNDNLVFTRLFKNPPWYERATKEEITGRLDVFRDYMENDRLSLKAASILLKASMTNPTFSENKRLGTNIIRKLFSASKDRSIWGWKEPNTQIYINEIADYFSNLKYIHIVRHGLDMAFSNNKQQLENWGYKYSILLDGKETQEEIAYKQLEFWVRSTKDALDKGKNIKGGFLLINHSDFCLRPTEQVDQVIQFLELDIGKEKLNELYQVPKKPATLGRFNKNDITIFDKHQIDLIEDLGFEI